ncbi:aldo/keto reductase [Actinoalloteichus hymeniacidonis]|uniref:Aldo/keto reductase, diketogulonate reductase n=1 Tax=Actinoalloteichus hymeniacidonis TaxID=340345 RepID=A0AAC9MYF5_9PSEU|nr:aldo/keto reductase [Actinoalloteichus hymeniacidonis]AOS64348.1 aldo/keto reductase, diketogulonate reductase [Actinoalloteichus hymeniacidonis]MBB5907584.1 diketogulonate reductase-like aldo/keto reductase [Actinoalloteichus hymeniacidonis]
MPQVSSLALNNGVRIPQLGFGVFQIPDSETEAAVDAALEAGYRSIDTANLYANEAAVGRAVRTSGIPREELFITTKLGNDDHGYASALRAFDESMEKLGLEYLDLYLIHWPQPKRDHYIDTWRAFEKLLEEERVQAIGVSNFQVAHLKRLLDSSAVVPSINQIELHPNLVQHELREFHAAHNILTEAWSPLAKGGLLTDPTITALAEKHDRTPAQVVLRWHIQLGNVVIPKSVTPSRIAENIDVFDFTLSEDDIASITGLNSDTRTGPHPDRQG